MNPLFIIPARGGSKGITRKNIKLLNGIPLIAYSIEIAKKIASSDNICISTDDLEIANVATLYGVTPKFIRPAEIATDNASAYDVYLHAINFFENLGHFYDVAVILQPTSPLRTLSQVKDAMNLYSDDIDMVVSVKETSSNPYYVLFEENTNGYLQKSKPGDFIRRQDCPKVYEYNGAVYVINIKALKGGPISNFQKVKKFVMPDVNSVDIDTPLDWMFAEFLLTNNIVSFK